MSNKDYDLNEFINGTMGSDARAEFEKMLESDNALQLESDFTAKLREGIQQQEVAPPGEFGLARLQRSIKQYEQEHKVSPTKQKFWKPVAIAASALLLLQSSVLVFNQNQETATDIGTLAGPQAQAQVQQLQLVFDASAPLAEIQALLQSVNATLIGGPGALGIYHIALASDSDMDKVLATLHASDLVQSISEP